MNKADLIHKQFIKRILIEGCKDKNPRPRYVSDGNPAHSIFITNAFEEYDISKGEIPITTLRPISWKSAINELLAIYQSQTNTQEGFESHKVGWWKPWMNEEGNIGRAYSYNLESHRLDEMKREVVKIKNRIIDEKYGEPKDIGLINPIQESIDGEVYFDRYIVIGKSEKTDSKKRKYYYIQFIKTGYITELRKDQIGKSKSFDPYERTIYGIGYLGNYKSVCNFTDKQIEILKDKWENMFRKCYSDRYEHKDLYENIFVHQDWHSFEQFLRDVRYLPQYHLAKEDDFKDWDLDKDYYGSNCYSKNTCVFLQSNENKLYSKSSPFKYKGKIYISQHDFAKEYNTSQSYVSRVLKKGVYKGEPIELAEDKDSLYRYELSRNQVNELLRELKENPFSRRHMLSFYNWANQDKKQLVECAFMTLWSVRRVGDEMYLDCTLIQRSSDYLVAGFINCIQYVALQMMIAQHCGYRVGKFARFTQNLHIYSRHIEQAYELLRREPSLIQPKLILNAEGKSFYEIEKSDFELIDYHPVRPQLKFDLGV
jgi:thymidylate synthase